MRDIAEQAVECEVGKCGLTQHSLAGSITPAGKEDFRFHDLRHTWASWLIQAGVPLSVLQEMGGWESIEMVRRHAHLAPSHMTEHAKQIDSFLGGNDTRWIC